MGAELILTPSLAKQWVENPSLIDAKWQGLFNPENKKSKTYQKYLEALSKGFRFDEHDGDLMKRPITFNVFKNHINCICSVVVYTANPEVGLLDAAIQTARNAPNFRDRESFLREQFVKAASAYLNELKPDVRTDMSYESYLTYYEKMEPHHVATQWVSPDFF